MQSVGDMEGFVGPFGEAAPVIDACEDGIAAAWVDTPGEVKVDVGGEDSMGLCGFKFGSVVFVAEEVNFFGKGGDGEKCIPAEMRFGAEGWAAGDSR
jgi:hypothetical protein